MSYISSSIFAHEFEYFFILLRLFHSIFLIYSCAVVHFHLCEKLYVSLTLITEVCTGAHISYGNNTYAYEQHTFLIESDD